MSERIVISTRPVAVDRADAAAMVGMSVDSLDRYVIPYVNVIRRASCALSR